MGNAHPYTPIEVEESGIPLPLHSKVRKKHKKFIKICEFYHFYLAKRGIIR